MNVIAMLGHLFAVKLAWSLLGFLRTMLGSFGVLGTTDPKKLGSWAVGARWRNWLALALPLPEAPGSLPATALAGPACWQMLSAAVACCLLPLPAASRCSPATA